MLPLKVDIDMNEGGMDRPGPTQLSSNFTQQGIAAILLEGVAFPAKRRIGKACL